MLVPMLLLGILGYYGAVVTAATWTEEQHSFMPSSSSMSPFSGPWLGVLQQFHATFGHLHQGDRDGCPFEIPTFACEPFEWHDDLVDRDAHHLRPQDIEIVIALGDSISAGFGMLSGRPPLASMLEYRGKAFSSGGDPDEYTIANFLSVYGDTRGAATGVTLPLSRGKQLNNAISGSMAQDLDAQVSRLVRELQSDRYGQHKDAWKLVTLFIGANNICVLCEPPLTRLPALAEADILESNVRSALFRLRHEVGKTFVNVVSLFNVSSVYEAARGDPYCELILDPAHMAICSCIQGDDLQRHAADLLVQEYNRRLQNIALEMDTTDFAVAYQPGFSQFPIAKYKQGFLSGIDCFHPNICANKLMSIVLWNDMFSDHMEKNEAYDIENMTIRCPGPNRPYLVSSTSW